ncbi:hypothetical protein [Actinoplanes sp. NPDC049681]|uniref:ATP-dependent DNA ligase n=1 Tax=Actinoplanes sp. NPDC049681 TaxID=3363905 RepID=UPI0037B4AA5C
MRAVGVPDLPAPSMCRGGCAYEIKFDGFRTIPFTRPGGVYLQSRQPKDLTPYAPEIAAAVRASLPPDTVVDGELIIFDPQTRPDVVLGVARPDHRRSSAARRGSPSPRRAWFCWTSSPRAAKT